MTIWKMPQGFDSITTKLPHINTHSVIALKIACNENEKKKKVSILIVQSADVVIGIYVYVIHTTIQLPRQSDKGSHLSRGTKLYFIYWFDGCRAWKTFKKLKYFHWFPKRNCRRRWVSRVLLCFIDFMSFWKKKDGNYTWANSSKNVKIVNMVSRWSEQIVGCQFIFTQEVKWTCRDVQNIFLSL